MKKHILVKNVAHNPSVLRAHTKFDQCRPNKPIEDIWENLQEFMAVIEYKICDGLEQMNEI
jgi:hypothetical protein